MKARLGALSDRLRASYWFVPALMTAGAIVLSFLTIALDEAGAAGSGSTPGRALFSGGPEGARTLLATAAASTITVSGVVFSIAIVAMTLASIQYGPRLLRNFMRDIGIQLVLGTFIATFLYCLLVLRAVRDASAGLLVPQLSVTVALVLTVLSMGAFIYFIHHAAAMIQVGSIISAAARDLDANIDVLYPEQFGSGPPEMLNAAALVPPDFETTSRPVAATGTGYLDAVDTDGLLGLASERDLLIQLEVRPGSFVEPGMVLARIWPGEDCSAQVERRVDRSFHLSNQRTQRQDVEFAIQQIVQVAVRALSPAINDPWTAFMGIDRLGAGLTRLVRRERPSRYRFDAGGRLRVIADAAAFDALVSQAFTEIRHAGRANLTVTVRLLETIATIAAQTSWDDELAALQRHADRVELGSREMLHQPWERHIIEERHRQALVAIRQSLGALERKEA